MNLDGYECIEQIGAGGMATVYKGVQLSLNRPVAIKVLSEQLIDDREILDRFNQESFIISRLHHPNIIQVIDRGMTEKGMPYFVMDFIQGQDLRFKVNENSVDVNRKLDYCIQICKALAYAHNNGVIHRDIKPANILVTEDHRVKILDFGIAQLRRMDSEKTRNDLVMGSLGYMSPEQQTSSASITLQSDIYSLGVLMYELFTGSLPMGKFEDPSAIDPILSKGLDEIILKCLNPWPEDRPKNADEVKERCLMLLKGGHLSLDQRKRANSSFSKQKNFVLLDVIKEDAFGAVYLHEESTQQTLIATKKCNLDGEVAVAGFKEAKLLSKISHQNIVKILGATKNDRVFVIAMAYVNGGSLQQRLLKSFAIDEFKRIATGICQGLAFAHQHQIIHGNLRPSNILFSSENVVQIADFGLRPHYERQRNRQNWYSIKGESASESMDIYACGVMFYRMVMGVMPQWKGKKLIESRAFKSLESPLQQLIRKMLHRDAALRFQSMAEVIEQLNLVNFQQPEKTKLVTMKDRLPPAIYDPKNPRRVLVLFMLLVLIAESALFFASEHTFMSVKSHFSAMIQSWLGS